MSAFLSSECAGMGRLGVGGWLRAAAAMTAVLLVGTLASCSALRSGGAGDAAPVGTLVMIIRHGEKPTGHHHGVDESGTRDKNSLTDVGWQRADALVNVFAPESGKPRAGLGRPATIFAAGANGNGDGTRTRETVAPLANRLGLRVDTSFGKGDEKKLVLSIASRPGPILVCWQHGEIPALAKTFGNVTPTPPSRWPDSKFDVIWTLTRTSNGWKFAQIPEMALPKDNTSIIGG